MEDYLPYVMEDFNRYLADLTRKVNQIDSNLFDEMNIKQGLRNKDKSGVLIGLTKIGDVVGYEYDNNIKVPVEGKLFFRGLEVSEILEQLKGKDKYFERASYLLLFGELPDEDQLEGFMDSIYHYSKEYIHFGLESNNLMNALQQNIAKLYSYDDDPDIITVEKILEQSMRIIGYFPDMILQGFLREKFDKKKSKELKKQRIGVAKYFLSMINEIEHTEDEVRIFDELLLLHLEHGGGNNSTFTVRVVTSAYTDTYSAMVAGICSLKGLRHGGANVYVSKMVEDIKENCNYEDRAELKKYLCKIVDKEAFDGTGLIYGMGHAVYTISDPRAERLRDSATKFAIKNGVTNELKLYNDIEMLTKEIFNERKKSNVGLCANVDLYSGFINASLGIDKVLYTPIFAMSRIPAWTAHRLEQLLTDKKILRPGYKTLKY